MTRRLKDALDVFFTDIHNSLLSTEYGVDASLPRGSLRNIREALEAEPETIASDPWGNFMQAIAKDKLAGLRHPYTASLTDASCFFCRRDKADPIHMEPEIPSAETPIRRENQDPPLATCPRCGRVPTSCLCSWPVPSKLI